MPKIELINADCMDIMAQYPDKYFDIAVVDPPYGLGTKTTDGGSKKNTQTKFMKDIRRSNWDNTSPNKNYFDMLKRISKNQIIWGGNYMAENIGSTKCIIVWDKMTYIPTMSQFEFAFCSINAHPKLIKINSNDSNRQHPTQKPIALYKWIFENYAKPGDKILDTHLGSGSSAIAAHFMGFDFVGIEIDKEYFDAAKNRFETATDDGLFKNVESKPENTLF